MSVLIVGADHLGSIPKELDKMGVTEIKHMTGRSGQKIRDGIPETMDFVIMLYDYVNHNLGRELRNRAGCVATNLAERSGMSADELEALNVAVRALHDRLVNSAPVESK